MIKIWEFFFFFNMSTQERGGGKNMGVTLLRSSISFQRGALWSSKILVHSMHSQVVLF
jgi:hypothetical protein